MTDINDDSGMEVSGQFSIERLLAHWIEMQIEDEKRTNKRFMVNKELPVQKVRFFADMPAVEKEHATRLKYQLSIIYSRTTDSSLFTLL
ncbi:predicted protein [Botrytis cinerea T4]|uniref:Uncharacterized protein n=1 Tax=Botryotinia fuckeliana (strain T4) TaxID=999810 RepID=G2YG83_BOTF4|nr:predicted protein [Botrytis cinerea T4]